MPRSLRIGLVFSYSLAYCRGMLRGIKQYAQTRHDWIFTPVHPDESGVRLLRDLRPAGIIAHIFNHDLAASLTSIRKPLVNVCGVLADLSVPRVGLDDRAIGQSAAAHLLEKGLRSFAFVGHPRHGYSSRREDGFRKAIARAGFEIACYHEPSEDFDPRGRLWSMDKRLGQWLLSLPKPVGIFACNDLWGVQLSEACRQTALKVPEDVAIVGVDNDDLLCELARPSLSSVAVPAETVGYESARLLDRLISGRRPSRRAVLVPPVGVVTRQSTDILAIADRDVADAVRLIREHADRPLGIQDILSAIPVSRRSLERRFRISLNRGIWEEIRRVHLERAKFLLSTTDLPVSQVATASGFSQCKHLSTVFRQSTGTTPTTYRRRSRAC